jgi:ABC-type Fe3+-siderophore transport system permease subunit
VALSQAILFICAVVVLLWGLDALVGLIVPNWKQLSWEEEESDKWT